MEAERETSLTPTPASAVCAECEQPAASAAVSRAGASLCAECVAAYYVECAACGGLVASDEAHARDGRPFCPECFARPAGEAGEGVVDETLVESLIAEYVSLHAEEKRIAERLEVVKEQLKKAATARRGEGSAVTLRAGEAAVRCSYRTSLKCDAEAVEALAAVLDESEFAALFERKTTYTPARERVAEFLSASDDERGAVREALRAALRETETVTLSVVAARK